MFKQLSNHRIVFFYLTLNLYALEKDYLKMLGIFIPLKFQIKFILVN